MMSQRDTHRSLLISTVLWLILFFAAKTFLQEAVFFNYDFVICTFAGKFYGTTIILMKEAFIFAWT